MAFELKNLLAGFGNFNANADINFTGGKLFGDICFIKVDTVTLPEKRSSRSIDTSVVMPNSIADAPSRLLVASGDGTAQAIAIEKAADPSSGPTQVNLSEVLPFKMLPCHLLDDWPAELPFNAVLGDRIALVVPRQVPASEPSCVELTQFARGQRLSVTLDRRHITIAAHVNSVEFDVGAAATIGSYKFAADSLKLDAPHRVDPDTTVVFSASRSSYSRIVRITISHDVFLTERHLICVPSKVSPS